MEVQLVLTAWDVLRKPGLIGLLKVVNQAYFWFNRAVLQIQESLQRLDGFLSLKQKTGFRKRGFPSRDVIDWTPLQPT